MKKSGEGDQLVALDSKKIFLGGGSTEYLRNVSFSKNILFMNFFYTWNNLKFDVSVIKFFFIGK